MLVAPKLDGPNPEEAPVPKLDGLNAVGDEALNDDGLNAVGEDAVNPPAVGGDEANDDAAKEDADCGFAAAAAAAA